MANIKLLLMSFQQSVVYSHLGHLDYINKQNFAEVGAIRYTHMYVEERSKCHNRFSDFN